MSNIEIERKYFINSNCIEAIIKEPMYRYEIKQGYLFKSKSKTVRIRIRNRYCNHTDKLLEQEAFMTIKGELKGLSVPEYEYKIPNLDAEQLLSMCDSVIEKVRYMVVSNLGDMSVWELDIFKGKHQGLVIAEIELNFEEQEFIIPEWFGQYLEVSEESSFRNAVLIDMSEDEIKSLIKVTLDKL